MFVKVFMSGFDGAAVLMVNETDIVKELTSCSSLIRPNMFFSFEFVVFDFGEE